LALSDSARSAFGSTVGAGSKFGKAGYGLQPVMDKK
jgi:hypothetical protein